MSKEQSNAYEEPRGELEEPPHKRRRWKLGTPFQLDIFLMGCSKKGIKPLASKIEKAPVTLNLDIFLEEMSETGIKFDELLKSARQKYADPAVSKYAKSIKLSPEEAQVIIMCTDPEVVNILRVWTLKGNPKSEDMLALYGKFLKILIIGLHKLELVSLHMLRTPLFLPPPADDPLAPKYCTLKTDQEYILPAPICGSIVPEFQGDRGVYITGQVLAYDVSRLSLKRDSIRYIIEPFAYLKLVKSSEVAIMKVSSPMPVFMPKIHFLTSLKFPLLDDFHDVGDYENLYIDHSDNPKVVDFVVGSIGGIEFQNELIDTDQPPQFRCIEFLLRILYENDESIPLCEKICTILYFLPHIKLFKSDIDKSKYLIGLLSIIIYSHGKSSELQKLATMLILMIDGKEQENIPMPGDLSDVLFASNVSPFSVNCTLYLLDLANRYDNYFEAIPPTSFQNTFFIIIKSIGLPKEYRVRALDTFCKLGETSLINLKNHTNYKIEKDVYDGLEDINFNGMDRSEILSRVRYIWDLDESIEKSIADPIPKTEGAPQSYSEGEDSLQEATPTENANVDTNEQYTNPQGTENDQATQYEEEEVMENATEKMVEEEEEKGEEENDNVEPEIEDENPYGDDEDVYEGMYKNLEMESSFQTVIDFVKKQLKKPKLGQEKAVRCAELFVLITKKGSQKSDSQALSKELLFDLLGCESASCWCDRYVFFVSTLIKAVESFSAQSIESFVKILFNLCKNSSNDPDVVKCVEKINDAFVPKIEGSLDSLSQKLFKLVLEDATSEAAREKLEMESAYSYMLIRMINFEKLTKSNLMAAKKHVVPILVEGIDTYKCICLSKLLNHPLLFESEDQETIDAVSNVIEYTYKWLTTEKPKTDRYSHVLLEGLHVLSSNSCFTSHIRKVLTPRSDLFTTLFDYEEATKDKFASIETACDILLNVVKKDAHSSDDTAFEVALNQKPFVDLITCITRLIKSVKERTPAENRVIFKVREILCGCVSCAIELSTYRRFLLMLINTSYIGVVDADEAYRQFVSVIKRFKISTRYTTRAMEFLYSLMKKCDNDKMMTVIAKYLREIIIDFVPRAFRPEEKFYADIAKYAIMHKSNCDFFASILAVIKDGSCYLPTRTDFSFLPELEAAAISILKDPHTSLPVSTDIVNSLRVLLCANCAIHNRGIKSDLFGDDFLVFLTCAQNGEKTISDFERARLSLISNILDVKSTFNSAYSQSSLVSLADYILRITTFVPENADDALCIIRVLLNGLFCFMDCESILSTMLGIVRTHVQSENILMGVCAVLCKMISGSLIQDDSSLAREIVAEIRKKADSESCCNPIFLKMAWNLLAGVYGVNVNEDEEGEEEMVLEKDEEEEEEEKEGNRKSNAEGNKKKGKEKKVGTNARKEGNEEIVGREKYKRLIREYIPSDE